MTMLRMTGALAALALLAGCGGAEGITGAVQGVIAPLVGTQTAAPAPSAGAATPVDPATGQQVEIAGLGVSGAAQRLIDNGASETFAGPGGFTYTLRDGMLVSTRGLGDDLMAADARQSRAALRAGGGRATRVQETLDGLDRIRRAEFDCVIAQKGAETIQLGSRQVTAQRFDEQCRGSALIFENYYWLDGAGEILSSRQFVSQSVAYLRSGDL